MSLICRKRVPRCGSHTCISEARRLVLSGAKDQAQLVLARRNFVVVLVDFHTQALHRGEHLAAQVLCFVDWVNWEVTALEARAVAHVAHLVLGVCVPRRVVASTS